MRKPAKLKQCDICLKHISMFAYNRHVKSHYKEPKSPKIKENVIYTCNFCSKTCKNALSLGNHRCRCKDNPDRKIQVFTDAGRESIKSKLRGRKHSEEHKLNISKGMKLAVIKYPESYSSGNVCGRVKIEDYNGERFHGKWEVLTAKWLDKNSIHWERKIKPLKYYWNEGWHLYFPDFYLPAYNLYLEVKGYETERDICKWNSLSNIVVFKLKEINKIKNDTLDISALTEFMGSIGPRA